MVIGILSMGVEIIMRKDKLYYHFGIMVEADRVLHYASKTNNMFKHNQVVRDDTLRGFSNDRKAIVVYHLTEADIEKIKQRAVHCYGIGRRYGLLSNNCITFILWCLTGDRECNFTDVIKYYIRSIWQIKGCT